MTSRAAVVALGLAASGCWLDAGEVEQARARVVESDADADVDADADADVDTDADADVDLSCADLQVEGAVASGTTVGEADEHSPTCAPDGAGGADVMVAWTPPSAGCYVGSTTGSTFDTVLVGLSTCGGPELSCDDDEGFDTTSEVWLDLGSDPMIWVVDGYGSAEGAWELHIDPAPVDVELGSTMSASGDTSSDDTTWTGLDCGGDASGQDVFLRWTAPSAGVWRLDLSSSHDAVLSVHPACARASIACSDVALSGDESVVVDAGAGESFRIRIAGWDPPFLPVEAGPWSLVIGPGP